MPTNKDKPQHAPQPSPRQTLRQQAEAELGATAAGAELARVPEETQRLLHELRVHQIELELQNEELRRAQVELESSRARYFDLYDLAPVGYVTLNARGLIQEANLTMATLLRVPRSIMQHQPLSRFIAAEDVDTYYQHQRRLVATGTRQVVELRLLRADGAPFWTRLEATVAQDAASETAVYRTVLSDITARVQAETALRELNATLAERVGTQTAALREREESLRATNIELTRALRLKDEFLAMMSHELRTPLNIILGFTEALTEELYGPILVRQRDALSSVEQSGRHLLALLSDILDLAYIASGHEALARRPIDVSQLCNVALRFVQPAAQARGLRLCHTVEHDISGLQADERRLTQILVNLLGNAVKFTPSGGTVGLDVSCDATQEHIRFSVWDTGIGIAAADQTRLFEPFTQLDGGLAREHEGVGLGLTLVRRLVELHNGSITLESTLGKGSRFTVSLPWTATDNQAPAAPPPPEALAPVWTRPPRVLLADDHELTLQFYADLLREQGCQVVQARTGDTVVAQVRATRPDVAVLDIQMPGMDGLAAIRQIRADPALASLPIIALTALVMPGDRERCLAAGANVYLAKPVSLRTLQNLIAAQIQEAAREESL